MASFAGTSYYVLRRTHKKKVLNTYATMLGFSFIVFGVIAGMSHYVDSKITLEIFIFLTQNEYRQGW